MKLTINFQIKDGKRIISRDTKGYKVLLNRITKEFEKLEKASLIEMPKNLTIDLIVQTSLEGSQNTSRKYSRTAGTAYLEKRIIKIFSINCGSEQRVLEVIAHEFGHFYDRYRLGYTLFHAQGTLKQEDFADKFAAKMVKQELSAKSATGRTKYARVKPQRIKG